MFDEDVMDHIAKINEGDGKITTWEELVEKFFCKFYPESYDGKDEMLDEGDNWGIDPLEFISRVNSSFENHMRVDGITKKVSPYGVFQFMDTAYWSTDLAGKEIDEVGEVSIIWNPMCVVVMLESRRIYNTHSCS
ncbi:hypothetical protein Tco_0790660 [Tanacetum coccineum]